MSGLVLKLAPKERILINKALIQNGERRTRFSILTPDVNLLRLRDAIHPSDTTTPVKKICHIAQLVLSGDADPKEAKIQLIRGLEQLDLVFVEGESRRCLLEAKNAVMTKHYYQALKLIRRLIQYENEIINNSRS